VNAFGRLLILFCFLASGCSVRRFAINQLGDALSGGGTTFTSDDDPELVKQAIPFSLKLMESLLAESPDHKGLLLATASGFTEYAYAFVQEDADEMEARDLAAATALRMRAGRLYLRARNYGLRGLALNHPHFETALRENPRGAVVGARKEDVPLLYWTGASWAAAIAVSKDNPDMISDVPIVEAMMDRALELDESYGQGAIHSFLIPYEMTRKGGVGDASQRARLHFARAMELNGGQIAGPLVSLAESVSVQKQDRKEFQSLLQRALAIDVKGKPESRLVNLVMQRRARWLLSCQDELFLLPESP
jgi:predicted anti-sigma-YlaC factor YlaD